MSVRNQAMRFTRRDGIIGGVASGLSRDLQIDVILLRIFWIVALCFGVGLLAYIMLWIAFPKADDPTLGNRKRVLGVCWKVAERADQPVGLIRFAALGLLLCSAGSAIVGYVLAMLILPPVNSSAPVGQVSQEV